MSQEGKQSRDQEMITKLRQIVLENLSNEQFGVEELAQTYGISRSQLHRKLRKLRKQSISQFIREIRLDEALKLLKQDAGSVSEIAYQVGFGSPTYFNTTFRNYFGYPPGEAKLRLETTLHGAVDASGPATITRKRLKKQWIISGIIIGIVGLLCFGLFISNRSNDGDTIQPSDTNSKSGLAVAILPLKNWSGNPDLDYVSYGITDAVIARIFQLNSIDRLIPFNTILGYANSTMSMKEIASDLNLDYLIDGNYQVFGNTVKVSIKLIDPSSDKQSNISEYYGEWKEEELFLIQANIAEAVVDLLEVEMSEIELESLTHIPTRNEAAYEAYLKGYYQSLKTNQEGFENALPLFEEAIALDPGFIDPYLGITRIWLTGGVIWGVTDQQTAWQNSKDVIKEAMRRDADRIYIEELSGFLCRGEFYFEWKFTCTEDHFAKYKKGEILWLDPAIRIDYIRKTGRFQDALTYVEEAIKSDPNRGNTYAAKAIALYLLDRKEEAFEFLQKSDNLFNDSYSYLMESAKLYYYLGEFVHMQKQYNTILSKYPDRPPLIKWFGLLNAEINQDNEYLANNKVQLLQDYENNAPGSPAWFLALYYAHITDYDKTFEWLQKSYDAHEVEMTWLKEEPLLRPVRSDPRYIELYNKVGFPFPISPTNQFAP